MNHRFEPLEQASKGAQLLYVTTSRYGPDWHSTLHTHPCMELFYCVRGSGAFVFDGGRIEVGPDDLVIVNADVRHTETSSAQDPLEYIALGVQGMNIRTDENDGQFAVLNYRERRSELMFYLGELLHESASRPAKHETVCRDLLEVLLIKLMRHTHFTPGVPERRGNRECAAARRYLDAHYTEPVTLDTLAQLTHVNKYYLAHMFSREFGISPINYLIERRIQESRYFLRNTDHSLSQISRLLGFSSPAYFSQTFRRLTGMSPMEYRRAAPEEEGEIR